MSISATRELSVKNITTFDRATPDGSAIPVEERHADEIRRIGGKLVFDHKRLDKLFVVTSSRKSAFPAYLRVGFSNIHFWVIEFAQ